MWATMKAIHSSRKGLGVTAIRVFSQQQKKNLNPCLEDSAEQIYMGLHGLKQRCHTSNNAFIICLPS